MVLHELHEFPYSPSLPARLTTENACTKAGLMSTNTAVCSLLKSEFLLHKAFIGHRHKEPLVDFACEQLQCSLFTLGDNTYHRTRDLCNNE